MHWSDLDWIRSRTHLPIVLKGIFATEDARLAVEHGVSAVIVSNHGAMMNYLRRRSTDCPRSSMPRRPSRVYLDGGIRRGEDILKALAFGARAVLLGRGALWAIHLDGARGIQRLLDILRHELVAAMRFCGIDNVEMVDRRALVRYAGPAAPNSPSVGADNARRVSQEVRDCRRL